MKRLWSGIVLFFVIALGVYFLQPMFVTPAPPDKQPQTRVEQTVASQEDSLSRTERIQRLFHFRSSVEEALNKRVPKDRYVPDKQLATSLKEALVATEDKRFYEHGAVDFYSIARAFYINTVAGETMEGGSTITQQLVKNLFLSSKRIMSRKVEEVILACMMEHYYSKDEILTMYLNSIYYGNNYTGIKEASQGYFGVLPKNLSLGQSAMLAGMPQAPSYYNPKDNYKAAKYRQKMVLDLMVQQGVISQREADQAYKADLGYDK